MKTTREMKRKGFTLVELLIVIVVIGVLSAMMMLSSTEAVSSAKAADIVSDLRNLKTAALAYYADHLDAVEATGFDFSKDDVRKEIIKYMGSDSVNAKYTFVKGTKNTEWYVKCAETDSKVADKLDSRKGTVGLYPTASSADKGTITSSTGAFMFIR